MRLTNASQVALVVANSQQSKVMTEIPLGDWPQEHRRAREGAGYKARPMQVWRSQEFLAVLWLQGDHFRLSVNRTTMSDTRPENFEDGISWDELMAVKSQCGFHEVWMVEVYPPDCEVVDVANMRHLWLMFEPPAFAWRSA